MNRKQLMGELLTQEGSQGLTDNIKILKRFLEMITTASQWRAFVTTQEGDRFGKYSYQVHKFHYCKQELINIFNK